MMPRKKENPLPSTVIIGDDGYPIPQPTLKAQDKFICICPICVGANARMSVAKTGNWIVRCGSCSIILYLNDLTSMDFNLSSKQTLNTKSLTLQESYNTLLTRGDKGEGEGNCEEYEGVGVAGPALSIRSFIPNLRFTFSE